MQTQTIAYDKALWRSAASLSNSSEIVEDAWREVADHAQGEGLGQVAARELAALTATARWSVAAASVRTESRGMHVRTDYPARDAAQASRLLVGGLEKIWSRYETPPLQTSIAA